MTKLFLISTGQHGGTIESVPLSCCKPRENENRDITIRSCQRTNLDAIYRDVSIN